MMELGPFTLRAVDTGFFRLDGGAMFGVVPKVLWSRTNPADELNRIAMAMRALVVEGEGRCLVIDAGAGTKLSDKMARIYAVETTGLRTSLEVRGIDPDGVTDAVATHLHFDHAGGFTWRDGGGAVRLSLPNAVHYVQRRQWDQATSPTEKDRASYFPEDLLPIEAAGKLRLIDGEAEIIPGVTLIPTEGHTHGHQVVLVRGGGRALLYCGDLIPLASHVNLPHIMAYDHFPLTTLEEKRRLLGRAADEGWILFFEHDPRIAACTVTRSGEEGFAVAGTVDIG